MINLIILKSWIFQVGSKCYHKSFGEGKVGGSQSIVGDVRQKKKRLELGMEVAMSQGVRRQPEERKGREINSPLQPPKGTSPTNTLTLAQ